VRAGALQDKGGGAGTKAGAEPFVQAWPGSLDRFWDEAFYTWEMNSDSEWRNNDVPTKFPWEKFNPAAIWMFRKAMTSLLKEGYKESDRGSMSLFYSAHKKPVFNEYWAYIGEAENILSFLEKVKADELELDLETGKLWEDGALGLGSVRRFHDQDGHTGGQEAGIGEFHTGGQWLENKIKRPGALDDKGQQIQGTTVRVSAGRNMLYRKGGGFRMFMTKPWYQVQRECYTNREATKIDEMPMEKRNSKVAKLAFAFGLTIWVGFYEDTVRAGIHFGPHIKEGFSSEVPVRLHDGTVETQLKIKPGPNNMAITFGSPNFRSADHDIREAQKPLYPLQEEDAGQEWQAIGGRVFAQTSPSL